MISAELDSVRKRLADCGWLVDNRAQAHTFRTPWHIAAHWIDLSPWPGGFGGPSGPRGGRRKELTA